MRPRHQQHRNHATSFGKVDVDVAEVRLSSLPGSIVQRQKGLLFTAAVLGHVTTNLVVATCVTFLYESAENLSRGVALLRRRRFVGFQDLIDQRMEWPQLRRWRRLVTCIRLRLGALKCLPNLPPRPAELFGDRPNAHAIAMSPSNLGVVLHRKHPRLLQVSVSL